MRVENVENVENIEGRVEVFVWWANTRGGSSIGRGERDGGMEMVDYR